MKRSFRALQKMQNEIRASKIPHVPLYITEWSSQNPAFIAHTIKGTLGLADILSYWTFDNVFEELGVPRTFMNRSFGLIGMRGVPRPSYHAFTLLHKLGDERIVSDDGPVLATRRKDGSLAILAWNLIPQAPGQRSSMGDPLAQTAAEEATEGQPIQIALALAGGRAYHHAQITRVDDAHGNLARAYKDIGSPAYPTQQQIAELKQRVQLSPPQAAPVHGQSISLEIPPNGLALIEVS